MAGGRALGRLTEGCVRGYKNENKAGMVLLAEQTRLEEAMEKDVGMGPD